MTFDAANFVLSNKCECCRKTLSRHSRAVCIVKWPDGGSDTLCVACYHSITRGAIAWYSYEGYLPQESPEKRLSRAADLAEREKAITLLEGLITEN